MQLFDAEQVRGRLEPVKLVAALREAFAQEDQVEVAERAHLRVDDDRDVTLLIMPAWDRERYVGVKVVGHYPRNTEKDLPSVRGSYLLMDAPTGQPLAVLDATELTPWRTAAASALAADYLAPETVGEHLLIGAGRVAAAIPPCYAAVREVGVTRVWARREGQAEELARQLREQGHDAVPVGDLGAAVRTADVITAATSSTSPLVLGREVQEGTHVDLIGAFSPTMVEADEDLVCRASLFTDGEEALQAGDLAIPLDKGLLDPRDVLATLADLASGRHQGRTNPDEVTLFKSVGTALEDLVAAALVFDEG